MTPLNAALTELHLAVQKCEARTLALKPVAELRPDDLHDHRTAVAGDMADALDALTPELGTRWMQAMYPEVNLRQVVDNLLKEAGR